MKIKLLPLLLLIFLFIMNCENRQKSNNPDPSSTDNSTRPNLSSAAAVENNKDSTRKFIRTADVKFRVIDVLAATYNIEAITSKNGGFVTFTNLSSEANSIPIKTLSNDSLLESTEVRVSNTMVIRVPNTKLDTVLREISQNIDYLDYRVIKAEDVALQLQSNNLEQKRLSSEKGGLNASNNNDVKQRDDAKISQLRLLDEINFSTVHLLIYQTQSIQRRVIPNTQNIEKYKPSFGYQMLEAFRDGLGIFEVILIFFTKLWGLVLLLIIAFTLYSIFKSKFGK